MGGAAESRVGPLGRHRRVRPRTPEVRQNAVMLAEEGTG